MSNTKKQEILEYWLLSIPNQGSTQQTILTLKRNVEQRGGEHYELSKLPIQRLKVGTLDKLIALSDSLGRIDATGKNVVQKLHRTYSELEDNTDQLLSVYNKSIRGYITNFLWDEGHFNPRAPLKDLVAVIDSNMVKTGEHLRKWTSTLTEIQNNLNIINRKKSGSLMNKTLNEYITHDDWYDGNYITTALVVVPNSKCNEFLEKYEFFENTNANKQYNDMINKRNKQKQQQQQDNDNKQQQQAQPVISQSINNDMNKLTAANCPVVVPDSQKFLAKDNEFSLFRILLLKRGYIWFKYVCMKQGYAVRDFNISDLDVADDEKKLNELKKKEISQKKKLKLFCKNTFSETFANWMHLKVIRGFVESVLRFGLPVDFTISVVKPSKGNEKKMLKALEQKYSFLLDKILTKKDKNTDNDIDYSGQLNDFYPFVYVQCKIEL